MKVARDIAGTALPFAAGTASAVWLGHFLCRCPHISVSIVYAAIIASTVFLLHPCHRRMPAWMLRAAITACMISCGILCGMTAELLEVGRPYLGTFMESVERLGRNTGNIIDSIPFRSSDTNALIKALIVGDRTDIPGHITDAFRKSGASHILALSGLHLGIIYGILLRISSVIGNSPAARTARSGFIVIACGLYTLATGAGASITRAFIFILLGEAARISGRSRTLASVLASSLIIHLTISPTSLQDVGFQLSYAAMAGIAFIYPRLRNLWPDEGRSRKGPLKWIWETASLSVSCQITTGPLAYLYFKSFPVHFLLTNLIAIPVTGLIIPAAVLTTCLHICGICPEILLRATEILVTALSEALDIISQM